MTPSFCPHPRPLRSVKASHILISADGKVYLSGLRSNLSMISHGQRQRVVHDFPKYSVKVLPWLSPEVLQQVCTGPQGAPSHHLSTWPGSLWEVPGLLSASQCREGTCWQIGLGGLSAWALRAPCRCSSPSLGSTSAPSRDLPILGGMSTWEILGALSSRYEGPALLPVCSALSPDSRSFSNSSYSSAV